MEKMVNYTPEQTQEVVAKYTAGMPVDMIAREMGKSARSIVAKLVREGVYVAKAKAQGTGRVTKEDLVARIENHFGLDQGSLDSFTKCSKDQLEALIGKF